MMTSEECSDNRDEQIDTYGAVAYERGRERGVNDREEGGYPNNRPLSGEWAGESVNDLLGDLISAVIDDALGDSAADWLCDEYERGYVDGYGEDSAVYDVCQDCYDVLMVGRGFDYVAPPDETRRRDVGVFPFRVFSTWPTGDETAFSTMPCECCGSTLFGSRFGVLAVHWED